jgi:hypothetical protein
MSYLSEIRNYIRDINLEIVMNNTDFKIDISKRYYNRFRLFYPSRKLIKYVTDIGGVLSGSRAIRCYTIGGKTLLERRVNDWDFIVTLDMAFRICNDMRIEEIPQIGGVISIKNQRRWVYPDYSDSYRVGPVDVQLIIKSKLPDYVEIDGVRIADFGYTVSEKVKLVSELEDKLGVADPLKIPQTKTPYNDHWISACYEKEHSKHISDLKEMIIKFNCLT